MTILVSLFLVFTAMLSAGILYQQFGLRRDRQAHPPLGRLISVPASTGTRQVKWHLLDQGVGAPAVMLESGIAGTLLGWSLVQGELAKFTCALSYDRAGLGWSSKPRQARTVEHMISELHELLNEAHVQRPLVLVGHSFGGLLVRAYAHRWPEQVAGLVLVDPVGHSGWANMSVSERIRLGRGVMLSRRGALLAEVGVVRGALDLLVSGKRWLPKTVSKASAGRGTQVLERLIGEVQRLPAWSHAKIRAHWSDARCFRAMADYLEALPNCASEAVDLTVPSHVPVTILSARTVTNDELAERQAWVSASNRGQHIVVADSSHWIQIQRPDVVISAVREMVQSATEGRSIAGAAQE